MASSASSGKRYVQATATSKTKQQSSANASSSSKTYDVYVGHLSDRTEKRHIEDLFSAYDYLEIGDIIFKKRCIFVVFGDCGKAKMAVRDLDGTKLFDEPIKVRFASSTSKKSTEGRFRVVVENLPERISWNQLKTRFLTVGEVTHADVHGTNQRRGVVEFKDKIDVRRAIRKYDGTMWDDRKINVYEYESDDDGFQDRQRGSDSPSGSHAFAAQVSSRSEPRCYFCGHHHKVKECHLKKVTRRKAKVVKPRFRQRKQRSALVASEEPVIKKRRGDTDTITHGAVAAGPSRSSAVSSEAVLPIEPRREEPIVENVLKQLSIEASDIVESLSQIDTESAVRTLEQIFEKNLNEIEEEIARVQLNEAKLKLVEERIKKFYGYGELLLREEQTRRKEIDRLQILVCDSYTAVHSVFCRTMRCLRQIKELAKSPAIHPELRDLVVPIALEENFLHAMVEQTNNREESIGFLSGRLWLNKYMITHCIITDQTVSSEHCIGKPMEASKYEKENNLVSLGWIHTHVDSTPHLSGTDMHTQLEHQLDIREAIAIVCSIKFKNYCRYTLTDFGKRELSQCKRSAEIHEHENELRIYEQCSHTRDVDWSLKVVDLRVTSAGTGGSR